MSFEFSDSLPVPFSALFLVELGSSADAAEPDLCETVAVCSVG